MNDELADIQLEKNILGKMLIDEMFRDKLLTRSVNYEYFTTSQHQAIFYVASQLMTEQTELDDIVLIDRLKGVFMGEMPWVWKNHAIASKTVFEYLGGYSFMSTLDDGYNLQSIESNQWLEIFIDLHKRRKIVENARELIEKAKVPSGLKTSELISEYTSRFEDRDVSDEVTTYEQASQQSDDRIARIAKDGFLKTGIKSGLPWLDRQLGDIEEGHIVVISADSSAGKTVLATHYLNQICMINRKSVLVFPLEMEGREMVDRLRAMRYAINFRRVKDGFIHEFSNNFAAMKKAESSDPFPMKIFDKRGYTIDEIKALTRMEKRVNPELKAVIIDHAELVKTHDKRMNDMNSRMEHISIVLKEISKELKVTPIIVAQHNTQTRKLIKTDDKYISPTPTDINYGASLFKVANITIQIGRYPESEIRELCITKNRDGGLGSAKFNFEGEFTRFSLNPLIENNQQESEQY